MTLMSAALFKNVPMEQVNVRLPKALREKAKAMAKEQSKEGVRFRESDVYRTAITLFFERNFTDSKVEEPAP